MEVWSSNLSFTAFILYIIATLLFGGTIFQKKGIEDRKHSNRFAIAAITVTIIGFASQFVAFILRWIVGGHAPVSNMYEFTSFFGMMLVGAFIVIYFVYQTSILGLFTLPIAILIIAYASMFPKDISPLIPPLQSYWLHIHVITTAAGQAILAISFATAIIYLVKVVDQTKRSKQTFFLESVMFGIVATVGFIVLSTGFASMDYKAEFSWVNKEGKEVMEIYRMPSLVGPNEGELLTNGMFEPLIEMPAIVNAKRLNTVIWSFGAGVVLYLLLRIIFRKRVSAIFQPLTKNINLDLIDEISYRSVLIGFPVFTLGGLIFAMIWAQIAWTRFWGWDPKEVWALITWLFYAAFLHLRLSKGWHGEKSAWLAVIGFAIIMFNLIVVNLIFAGLHSYA